MTDGHVRLWHLPSSHYSEKARWALEHKRIAHTRADAARDPALPRRARADARRDADVPRDRAAGRRGRRGLDRDHRRARARLPGRAAALPGRPGAARARARAGGVVRRAPRARRPRPRAARGPPRPAAPAPARPPAHPRPLQAVPERVGQGLRRLDQAALRPRHARAPRRGRAPASARRSTTSSASLATTSTSSATRSPSPTSPPPRTSTGSSSRRRGRTSSTASRRASRSSWRSSRTATATGGCWRCTAATAARAARRGSRSPRSPSGTGIVPPMPISLSGASVAVTGGANGIGRAIATQLRRAGAKVAVGDRDLEAAQALAREHGVLAHELDVADEPGFRAFLDAAEQAHGPLDVMVNNAGVDWIGPFHEEPHDVTRREIEVNLLGTTIGSKLALQRMLPRGRGHLVNVASGVGRVPLPGSATYSATKHGVVGLTESLRLEYRGSGIGFSVIQPAQVETAMLDGQGAAARAAADLGRRRRRGRPRRARARPLRGVGPAQPGLHREAQHRPAAQRPRGDPPRDRRDEDRRGDRRRRPRRLPPKGVRPARLSSREPGGWPRAGSASGSTRRRSRRSAGRSSPR